MSSQPKHDKKRCAVPPHPHGCGFSLHDEDQQKSMFCVLGDWPEKATDFCGKGAGTGYCWASQRTLSPPSRSFSEELLVDIPDSNWPDHMELIDGVQLFESARKLQLELATQNDYDDVVDINLQMHGLSEDEQDSRCRPCCSG